ncbi:MAG TPA: HEAT repeat domain-containing protein, partial [Longimicrobiaceae bacterium]|nr:HEAT repeat domain-containing protein [Longimicrobiaceae bacterium]
MFDAQEARRRARAGQVEQVAAELLAAAREESPWMQGRAREGARALAGLRGLLAPLEAALRDGDDPGRRNAARSVLAALSGPGTAPAALRLLGRLAVHDADEDVRLLAASALGESGNPAARRPLEAALRDGEGNVAAAAADGLGTLADPRSVPALCAAVGAGDPWRAAAAAVALGRIGDVRALPALAAVLDDPLAGPAAAEAIGEIRDPAGLTALRAAAASDTPALRDAALEAAAAILAYQAEEPPEWLRRAAHQVEPALVERLAQGEDSCAAVLLGAAASPEATDALMDALLDPARSAAGSAGIAVLPPERAVPALLDALENRGCNATEELLAALPALPDAAAAERVAHCLGDAAAEVRAAAADALARSPAAPGTGDLLRRLLDEPAYRPGAALALARLPGSDPAALLALLGDPDAHVRAAAAEGLARAERSGVAAEIAGALEAEGDEGVRHQLVAALGAAGGADAVPVLARIAAQGDPRMRFAAVRALGRTGGPGALPPLLGALSSGDAGLEA